MPNREYNPYKGYFSKLMKKHFSGVRLSKEAKEFIDEQLYDIFMDLVDKAEKYTHESKIKTMNLTAVYLAIDDYEGGKSAQEMKEFAMHAIANYDKYVKSPRKGKSPRVNSSQKTGLIIPVPRTKKNIKDNVSVRVSQDAAIAMTGAIEGAFVVIVSLLMDTPTRMKKRLRTIGAEAVKEYKQEYL